MPEIVDYSEKELVEQCAKNKRQAQEALYRRFFPAMLRMCLRYSSDKDIALEILNAGFLRVFQKIHTFSFSGSLEGWIRRIIFHSISDYFRQHGRQETLLDWDGRDAPTRATALNELYFQDIMGLVDQLPAAEKEFFGLYAIEGFTHAEIGERLNMSPGTSKWHSPISRKQLKESTQHLYNNSNYAG
ncbi:MAG: RNA polymerase sigma factor [Haliscomenobacter sp.]|nr:RNA polymerase sigma factor [Haliscomenobacter sp.]